MPRSREFEPQEALDQAMKAFWQRGYADTSVGDLVEATGVNRYGLYDVFESKRGLYLAALERYRQTVIAPSLQGLEDPESSLAEIKSTFRTLVFRARSGEARFGCLLCNAAEETAPFDETVASEVSEYQRRLVSAFSRALERAVERGEVPGDADTESQAVYLAGLLQGASFLCRSPASAESVARFVEIGLGVLNTSQ